jgi:putative hydrolases of HD superfamily
MNKPWLLKIFEAASMQRWNDQIRPIDLSELDKQAHKMIVAYTLGKSDQTRSLNWIVLIERGLFEFLQRIVITDIKPPVFHEIKEDREKYLKLNNWVLTKLKPILKPLDNGFLKRFESFLFDDKESLEAMIIEAAHFYVTKWEFDIIKRFNPNGYLVKEIEDEINRKQQKYRDLEFMDTFMRDPRLLEFVNICGQLRFQIRWSHLYRVPKTSVLGHMLIVAIFSYIFSMDLKADDDRKTNNYFTGLFHDLPEVLTRDIINPVKRSVEGLSDLIKEYEKREMNKKIYNILPKDWHSEMKLYTEDEFSNISGERDGGLVKACDDLSAFIEAYLSLKNGIQNEDIIFAKSSLFKKYQFKKIQGIDFGKIYEEFIQENLE